MQESRCPDLRRRGAFSVGVYRIHNLAKLNTRAQFGSLRLAHNLLIVREICFPINWTDGWVHISVYTGQSE
jgi:hypothetical protein